MVVESESLLNDGVAAVGFAILISVAAGDSPTVATIVPLPVDAERRAS